MAEKYEERNRAEKRARSEAKRLEAIRVKAELDASRDRVVGLGLKDVDNEKKRKKITFESESEDEREKSAIRKVQKLGDNEGTSKGMRKQSELFGSDEEEEEAEIVFKNRHKGEKGIKLMQQEARFGNDHRFKLNEKFEDSDEEEEAESNLDRLKKELLGEKEGALSVLARVLGKELKRDKPSKEKKSKARPFTRFDPDNEDHVKWMRENMKKPEYVEEKEVKQIDEGDNDREVPQICQKIDVDGRFFEMGGDFAKELKEKLEGNKRDEPFSFLASIGREEKNEEKKGEASDEEVKLKDEGRQTMKHASEEDPMGFYMTPSMGFFFDVFSLSVRSVVANFRRTQSIDKVREKWSEQRESIVKTYKNQRRFAVKNVRDEKKGYEKKEGGMFKKNEDEENGKNEKGMKKSKSKKSHNEC
ncbi:hypothetical protein PMAYCL1PPCAC_18180 [Pristionchus mayeri]|uniref:Uncharacterized protein n=1 Tax=Pristionchus mayeri TaxID=1317129 RepID=A0AAN5I1C9_9BILA|nr:hypothetical protein PMAYCL1PPCAC_18180 [Pristionchus mayeri]